MSFAIVADFLLGTYRAHRADGSLDVVPSPARLHGALLNAAGQGSYAGVDDGNLAPSQAAREALDWFERHPPDGLVWPSYITNRPTTFAYRNKGIFRQEGRVKWLETRPAGPADGCVSLSGPMAWTWTAAPPGGVAEVLGRLCEDVAYLGTADSPVLLRIGDLEPTHELDTQANVFSGGGVDVAVPIEGRTSALEAAHAPYARSVPSILQDRAGTSESEIDPTHVTARLAQARYRPRLTAAAEVEHPLAWDQAVIIPLAHSRDQDAAVRRDQHVVAQAVAVHRALVSRIGDDAPPLVTGHYLEGAEVPANRLAIHFVSRDDPLGFDLTTAGAAVLLIPADASTSDLAVLDRAVRGLTEVRTPVGVLQLRAEPFVVDAARFWAPALANVRRVWSVEPAAIPESFPIRGHRWTLGEAATLSIGLVYRDILGGPWKGRAGYLALLAAAKERGVHVLSSALAHHRDPGRYVHRVRQDMVVQPYRALVDLGDLAGDQSIVAIGQSRHLGGGLLVPVDDLPAGWVP